MQGKTPHISAVQGNPKGGKRVPSIGTRVRDSPQPKSAGPQIFHMEWLIWCLFFSYIVEIMLRIFITSITI